MTGTTPGALLFGVIMYSLALFGLALLVIAFVRMSRTLTRIGKSLEEIAAALRSNADRR
jgi:hypothetical protein